MLEGRGVRLRTVRESDLDALYEAHCDIRNRGPYFPLGVHSEPDFRRDFAEHGFWQKSEGMLLITARRRRGRRPHRVLPPGRLLGRLRAVLPALRRPSRREWLRHRGRPAPRRLPVLGQEGASDPAGDRAGERCFAADRGQVRLHSRGHGPGRLLQPGPQPGRTALFTAQHRPSALAGNHNVRVTVRYSAVTRTLREREASVSQRSVVLPPAAAILSFAEAEKASTVTWTATVISPVPRILTG